MWGPQIGLLLYLAAKDSTGQAQDLLETVRYATGFTGNIKVHHRIYWKHSGRPQDLLETLGYATGFTGNIKVPHRI